VERVTSLSEKHSELAVPLFFSQFLKFYLFILLFRAMAAGYGSFQARG